MDLKLLGSFFILSTLKLTSGVRFNISNNCLYTVWAAAIPGGGKKLSPGEDWVINIDPYTIDVNNKIRIWGRTNCKLNGTRGSLNCETGDCDGALQCRSTGSPPYTLAEYSYDNIDISLLNGFNIPIEFRPINSSVCTGSIKCSGDINSICPTELTDPGGCNHPCTVFGNEQYCCTGTAALKCTANLYTKLFKDVCPNVITIPFGESTEATNFTCPPGTDYDVQFCPQVGILKKPTMLKKTTMFNIQNNCPFPVWAAAAPTGGGRRLDRGQTWDLAVAPDTFGRIWARTNCTFNASGHGSCETGDCNGLLECQGYGSAPRTTAEYSLNQYNNNDFFDISVVDGFNVGMEFSPTSSECTKGISCTGDINGQCPIELKTPGGCNGACTVFQTPEYCCTSPENCGPTKFSKFFKDRCENVYTYSYDDDSNTFTCPSGTKYRVVFCP